MSALFQRLVAELPERHAPGKNSFATDAKALRNWISHLPLANPGATARLLIGALREMNQLRVEALQRLDALEMLRPSVDQIVTWLGRQTLGDSLPLPPQKQQLGQLAQDFERELALGYSAVVCDLCAPAGAVPFMRGKAAALALTRAIQHRNAGLFEAYLLYRAPPAGAWQSLHDLFRFAVAVQADDKPLEDPLCGGAPISVRMAYMHALLFALSNPYRFTQKENCEIHELTRIWAAHCELREGRAPQGAVAVRTDADLSPGYLPEEREVPSDGLWAFEISGLVRFVEGQLAMLPPGLATTQFRLRGGPAMHAEVAFVERLMRSWDAASERSRQRLAAGHQLETVIGLHDLHFVLAGNQDFETFLRKTRGVAITLHENDRVATWASGGNGNAPLRVKRLSGKVLDQSLGGYRLVWDKVDSSMRVRVGELVGLAPPAEDDEAQDWMVGSIRWLRIEPNGAMDAGIELLAPRAVPIGLRSYDPNGVPRAAMRGVLLESIAPGEELPSRTVIAPHLFDHDAHEIELTRPGDPYGWPPEAVVETLRGVDVVDNGSGYLRIDLNRAPSTTQTVAKNAANDDTRGSPGGSALAT